MSFDQERKTALVLFTLSAREEARVKDFSDLHSFHTNELIATELISHAEQVTRQSGLPSFIFGPELQKGNAFGEKLGYAFESIFALGFENVIAIGNDCPELTPNDITTSALQLETHDAVIGPDAKGGLYLIGLNRYQFDLESFYLLPWESQQLATSFFRYLSAQNASVHVHSIKSDISTYKEMVLVLKKNITALRFKFRLLSILASCGFKCV